MSRTTGRCVGAALAALPVDLEQHGRLDAAESRRPLVAAEARNAPFGEAGDAIAYLDALAAQMRACGWTAYINPPARRFASLFVQDPQTAPYGRTLSPHPTAAPITGGTGSVGPSGSQPCMCRP